MKYLKTYESSKKDVAFSVGDIVKNIDGYLNKELFKVIKIYKVENNKNIYLQYVLNSELMSYYLFVDAININNKKFEGTYAQRFIKASEEETKQWELDETSNKYNI